MPADLVQAAGIGDALGDVVRGGLQVQPGGHAAGAGHRQAERRHLLGDAAHQAGLVAAGRDDGVAVHRVAQPDHRVPGRAHRLHQRRQALADLLRAHPRDQRQAPRLAARIEALAERQQLVAADLRADLAGHRVEHLGQQRHMGTVDLAGALADPRPVGRTEVDPALLVLAQHRQLVVEQQHLVAGPDRRGIRLLPGRGVPAQVAHDVARRRVALEDPLRIGPALLGMGLAAVDHVAAIDRQGLLADLLVRLGTRLGVLPGDAPDADHRPPAGQAQGAGQQFQHGGLARHVLGMVVVHVLGAVAALHHQRLAAGDPRQGRAQGQDVAGADQRRTAAQVRLHVAQARRIAPFGLLQRFAAPYALQ